MVNMYYVCYMRTILEWTNHFLVHYLKGQILVDMITVVVTFVYDYLDHHLQQELWDQIKSLLDKSSKHWLILGDFNELSLSQEKMSFSKGNSANYNNLTISSIITT